MDHNALHSRTLPLARVICKCILGSCLNVLFFFVFFFRGSKCNAPRIGNTFWVRVSISFHQRMKIVCGLYCPYLFPVLHIV